MVGGVDRFMEAAAALGIDPYVRRFPQGTKTAADAAAAIGCEIGQIMQHALDLRVSGIVERMLRTSAATRVVGAKPKRPRPPGSPGDLGPLWGSLADRTAPRHASLHSRLPEN
jgi:hypothetical protein